MSHEALDNLNDHPETDGGQTTLDTEPYTPVFDATVRTTIYVTCAILGVVLAVAAPVAIASHAPEWVTILLSAMAGAVPTVAAAFGVAYNPSRKV